MRRIISNTSCLIALTNIGRLEILQKLYGTVSITPEVYDEFGEAIPDWFNILPVIDSSKIKLIQKTLDLGESSSIALAMEIKDHLLILDDGKARKFSKSMGLTLTGTIGVIIKAKQTGFITEELSTIISEFKQCGFRLPPGIEKEFLLK
jgi:predicted nucleic acid-binding protein